MRQKKCKLILVIARRISLHGNLINLLHLNQIQMNEVPYLYNHSTGENSIQFIYTAYLRPF